MFSSHLLITGGAGFIGSNFVHHWCQQYPQHRVIVLDALTYAGNRQTLADLEGKDNFRFVQGDICDRDLIDSLLREEQIDMVAHFAAVGCITQRAFLFLIVKLIKLFIWLKIKDAIALVLINLKLLNKLNQ